MVFVLAVLRMTALVVKKIGCENLLLLVSLWLLLLLTMDCELLTAFLIDDTKLLVLSGTMQYKVHEWYINWMNG
jgi:hypothetical protein